MPEQRVNGVRLYYEEHGEGLPILCIHGTSSSAMIWGAAVQELATLGRVIVYDRRGCTRSERPDPYDRTTVSEHADDAAALLEALSAVPAIVIGRSYGGEVAVDIALRYSGHVRALVLLEAAILNLVPEASRLDRELHERVRAAAARGVDTVGETFIRAVLGDDAWEGFSEHIQRMFTDNGQAILAEFNGGPLDVDRASLSTIEQPALLLAASESPEPFRRVTDAMAQAIPNSRQVLVGGGHLVSPTEPAVMSFIEEVRA